MPLTYTMLLRSGELTAGAGSAEPVGDMVIVAVGSSFAAVVGVGDGGGTVSGAAGARLSARVGDIVVVAAGGDDDGCGVFLTAAAGGLGWVFVWQPVMSSSQQQKLKVKIGFISFSAR